MTFRLPNSYLDISDDVRSALHQGGAVVALESTIISHGLPKPENLETARSLEGIIKEAGAVPATIAIIDGTLKVGLSEAELEFIATSDAIQKASIRDLPVLLASASHGATTVASTLKIASMAGIRVMATGGIGGVHRGALGGSQATGDISADLRTLAETTAVVVCSGAKSILDLRATREYLETAGVTVLGYCTDQFPGFYSVETGLLVDKKIEKAAEAAKILRSRETLRLPGAVLLTNPPPASLAMPKNVIDDYISRAYEELDAEGADLTPYLLKYLSEASAGQTVKLNRALVESNAALAADVAMALTENRNGN
jgi:pseudouridine-5'-phosphate glycosidase